MSSSMLGPVAVVVVVVVVVMPDTLRERCLDVKPPATLVSSILFRYHRRMPDSAGERVTAGDLLTLDELTLFRRTSGLRGAWLIAHAWATIVAAAALYVAWPSALTLGVAVVVVGARQLGLMALMHETAHWLLFPGPRLNTWVGTWLCAAPLGADLRGYRRRHHLHHRHTQQPEDPDLSLSARFPISRGRLALTLLGDLCGYTALRRIAAWRPPDHLADAWRRARAPLAANAVLFAICAAVGGWWLYLLVWVLPWATWYQLATRIRDIPEHGMVAAWLRTRWTPFGTHARPRPAGSPGPRWRPTG
jgi:fatty acid desaturase